MAVSLKVYYHWTHMIYKLILQLKSVRIITAEMLRKKKAQASQKLNKENIEPEYFLCEKNCNKAEDIYQRGRKIALQVTSWAEDDNILSEIMNKTPNYNIEVKKNNFVNSKNSYNRQKDSSKHNITESGDYKSKIQWLKKEAEFLSAHQDQPKSQALDKFPKKKDFVTLPKTPEVQSCQFQDTFRSPNKRNLKKSEMLSINYPTNYSFLLSTPIFCKVIAEQNGVLKRPYSSLVSKSRSRKVHSQSNDIVMNAIASLQSTRPMYIPSSFRKCRKRKRSQSIKSSLQSELNSCEFNKPPDQT